MLNLTETNNINGFSEGKLLQRHISIKSLLMKTKQGRGV